MKNCVEINYEHSYNILCVKHLFLIDNYNCFTPLI